MSHPLFSREGLLRYHELAHEGLAKLFAHVETLPHEDITRAVEGFGFPSLRAQLAHIVDVEAFWVIAIEGRGDEPFDWEHEADLHTAAELSAYRREVELATRAWLSRIDEASLNAPREVPFFGYNLPGVPGEMLLHLMTHAFHHKGQAAAMCRLLGHPAPLTDMLWIKYQLMD